MKHSLLGTVESLERTADQFYERIGKLIEIAKEEDLKCMYLGLYWGLSEVYDDILLFRDIITVSLGM